MTAPQRPNAAEQQEILLQTLQQQTADPDVECPALEAITDYAEEIAAPQQRAILQDHLRRCPACASLVAAQKARYAPILRLHNAQKRWRSLKALTSPPALQADWESHCQRCPACRFYQQAAKKPLRFIPLAGGGALAAAICIILFRNLMPASTPAPASPSQAKEAFAPSKSEAQSLPNDSQSQGGSAEARKTRNPNFLTEKKTITPENESALSQMNSTQNQARPANAQNLTPNAQRYLTPQKLPTRKKTQRRKS